RRAASRDDAAGAGRSGRPGTASAAPCGGTSRKQPTAAAIISVAPRPLTGALVTGPANSSVVPDASTMGHAVGAGIARVFVTRSVVIPIASAPDDVHHGEHHDPDRVDEMPIQS